MFQIKKDIEFDKIKKGYLINELSEVFNKNTGKWLKGSLDKDGYLRYHLQREGTKSKTYRAHRLSMITFKFVEGFSELEVNHKDGDKLNNNIENLEWCSTQENIAH